MKCELCFDDCLDLPSLNQIQGNQDGIHRYMGYVILESMIWFDLIWFDMIRHSKSHWKQHSIRSKVIWIHCWFASNKYFSISFPFSRFRCFCFREIHSKKVEILVKLEKTAFLSLAERRRRKLKFNLFVHSQTRFHSFSSSFFNKQLPFIHSHSFNIIKSNQAKAKANQDEKRKKQRKWTSSTTIEQIENPIRLTSVWREYEQTTLTQLPAFSTLCKCNEHLITSNAHWYPSGH